MTTNWTISDYTSLQDELETSVSLLHDKEALIEVQRVQITCLKQQLEEMSEEHNNIAKTQQEKHGHGHLHGHHQRRKKRVQKKIAKIEDAPREDFEENDQNVKDNKGILHVDADVDNKEKSPFLESYDDNDDLDVIENFILKKDEKNKDEASVNVGCDNCDVMKNELERVIKECENLKGHLDECESMKRVLIVERDRALQNNDILIEKSNPNQVQDFQGGLKSGEKGVEIEGLHDELERMRSEKKERDVLIQSYAEMIGELEKRNDELMQERETHIGVIQDMNNRVKDASILFSSSASLAAESRATSDLEADKAFRKKYGLPSTEFEVTYYTCSSGSKALRGYLYITPRFLVWDAAMKLFTAGDHILISMEDVEVIEKVKQVALFPGKGSALRFHFNQSRDQPRAPQIFTRFLRRKEALDDIIHQVTKHFPNHSIQIRDEHKKKKGS